MGCQSQGALKRKYRPENVVEDLKQIRYEAKITLKEMEQLENYIRFYEESQQTGAIRHWRYVRLLNKAKRNESLAEGAYEALRSVIDITIHKKDTTRSPRRHLLLLSMEGRLQNRSQRDVQRVEGRFRICNQKGQVLKSVPFRRDSLILAQSEADIRAGGAILWSLQPEKDIIYTPFSQLDIRWEPMELEYTNGEKVHVRDFVSSF